MIGRLSLETYSIMPVICRLFPKLVLILSFTGFVLQVLQVSLQYFAYSTTSIVWLILPEVLRWHDVLICLRYGDLLDTETLERDTGIKYQKIPTQSKESLEQAIENESLMKIAYIFDYTPKPDDVLESCMYRPDDWGVVFGDACVCRPFFNVTRIMTQELMCYDIQPRFSNQLTRTGVTLSTFFRYRIFELLFNQNMSSALLVNAIAVESVFHVGFTRVRDTSLAYQVKRQSQVQLSVGDPIRYADQKAAAAL